MRDICDELHAAVTDLSQWEEPESQGIRAHLYREGFPFFMRSRVHDCAHTRPLGVSMDFLMLRSIRAREPDGDGPLGALIDGWVLGLPFMESLRSRGRLLTRTVLEHTSDWKAKIPMPIIYVGTGTSEELLDFALEEDAPALHISCIENEPAAFAEPVRQLTELGRADFLSCVNAQVTLLPRGGGVILSGQKVVCSSGILDRLNDDDIVEFFDWAIDCLAPSGILVACQTHSDNPDRSYLEHILGWSVYHRNEEELAALFARSRFPVEGTVLERHVDGVLLVAVAKKPK